MCIIAVLSLFVGPALLIAGGILFSVADCESVEVVGVLALRPAVHGIGLCDATFTYYASASASASLVGTLTTPCPVNGTDIRLADVAVCYPVMHPDRYKAALLASDLVVTPHSVPLTLLLVGGGVTAFPFLLVLVGKLCDLLHYRQ